METGDDFVLARFLHPDGWVTYRVFNADGTDPDESNVPEHLTNSAKAKTISFIGDPQYRLSHLTSLTMAKSNLMRLQNIDSLLLEEVLVFLETAHQNAAAMLSHLLAGQDQPAPPHDLNDQEFAAEYRGLMLAIPLLVELFSDDGKLVVIQRALGGALLRDAKKSLGSLGHEHVRGILLATWIMQQLRYPGDRVTIDYRRNAQNIEFITAHLDEVMGVRRQLGERHTIDRETIAGLIAVTTPAISDGWL